MNIFYIANIRMPTEKAHGAAIMKACEAFVRTGNDVELVVPKRRTHIQDEVFSYYSIHDRFPLKKVFTLDLVQWGKIGFFVQSLTFAFSVLRYLSKQKEGVLYGRDEVILAVLVLFSGRNVVWESHDGAWNIFAWIVARRARGLIVVSEGAKRVYEGHGVARNNLAVVRNGVDLSRYEKAIAISRDEARRTHSLPLNKKIAIYNGHLHTWKGAGTLAQAALLLPKNFLIMFMGGTDGDIATFKEKYAHDERITIIGRKSDEERPLYLRAADVAVLPNTAENEISARYTSPLKLFGYMAAGVPVVASDIPSIRELLSDDTAYFATPDDPRSFAQLIKDAAEDSEAARAKARKARLQALQFDWRSRAEHIVQFLESRGIR